MTPTFRRDAALAAIVVLAVSAIVSVAPPPDATRLNGELHDFAHVLVFGGLRPSTAPWCARLGRTLAPGVEGVEGGAGRARRG